MPIALNSFLERYGDIHYNQVEWFFNQEQLHLAPVVILLLVADTACAVPFDPPDVSSHTELVKRL